MISVSKQSCPGVWAEIESWRPTSILRDLGGYWHRMRRIVHLAAHAGNPRLVAGRRNWCAAGGRSLDRHCMTAVGADSLGIAAVAVGHTDRNHLAVEVGIRMEVVAGVGTGCRGLT